jgi:hypothetical protein
MKTTTGTHSISGIARVASIGAIASVISITSAVAQPHQNYNINRRTEKQSDHIKQGMQSGSLTQSEVNQLRNKTQGIDAQMDSMRAANNGHLTTQERHEALRAQNRLARDIYQFKHNQDGALSAAPTSIGKAPRKLAASPGPQL